MRFAALMLVVLAALLVPAAAQETSLYQPSMLVREGNFRGDPSTKNPPLGLFPAGTQVLVLGEVTETPPGRLWNKVAFYDGRQGYMAASLLRPLPIPFPTPPDGYGAAVVQDPAQLALLVGGHGLTLQWVGWEKQGEVVVYEDLGRLWMKGRQDGVGKTAGSWMTIEGWVTLVGAERFVLQGRIEYLVPDVTGNRPCRRDGTFNFSRVAGKKYWRLDQTQSPCGGGQVDYVDVYLRDE